MVDEPSRRKHLNRKRAIATAAIIITAAVLIFGSFGWGMYAAQRAQDAATNAQTLAEQVKQACATGQLVVDERNLCAKADRVAEQPAELVAGPPGPEGPPGPPGTDGADGVNGRDGTPGTDGSDGSDGNPGANGSDGEPGEPGTNGPAGTNGAAGANGVDGQPGAAGPPGPPGPAGKDGQPGKDGATGPQGPAGKDGQPGTNGQPGQDGVGITSVECVGNGDASHWVITYSNSMQQTSDGPCRLQQPGPPVTINP
jgi:hypothetical protein